MSYVTVEAPNHKREVVPVTVEVPNQTYKVQEVTEPIVYEPVPVTFNSMYDTYNYVDLNNSSSFLEAIRQRIKYVFKPLLSSSSSRSVDVRTKYRPRIGIKKRIIYKPEEVIKKSIDIDYSPKYKEESAIDFAPINDSEVVYRPEVTQESYPTFMYNTFGLPNTFIDEYAPQETVKIKPVTDFEINAKPKPLIVSQSHLILLDRLLREVF